MGGTTYSQTQDREKALFGAIKATYRQTEAREQALMRRYQAQDIDILCSVLALLVQKYKY